MTDMMHSNGVGMEKHLASVDLNLLVALEAMLAERSVTVAARSVGMTQSGMSNALGRLRTTLGDPLLVRAGQAMVLTPRAEALAGPLREALDLVRRGVLAEPGFSAGTDTARLRVSCSDFSVLTVISPLVRHLAQVAPNVIVDVLPRAEDPAALLRDGGADLVIEPTEVMPGVALPSVDLFEDRWLCCVWAHSPLPGGVMTLPEYLRRGHVVYSMGGQHLVSLPDAHLEREGVERRIYVKVESFLMAPYVLQGTDMVTIVPSRSVPYIRQATDVRILELPVPLPSFTQRLWWHPRQTADPAHAWVREQIVQVAASPQSVRSPGPPSRTG